MCMTQTLVEKGNQNEKLTEMVTFFKNKLINENCFHTTFGAQKIQGNGLKPLQNNKDLTIGFVKDQIDEDEFYLEIVSKDKNPKTGAQDRVRIAVDDIDEIEHVEGTLQFYVHYQGSNKKNAIGSFLQRKINKK